MRTFSAAAAVLVLLLAACSTADVISTVPQSFASADESDDFSREAAIRDIPVIVRGRVFGAEGKTLESEVVNRMRGAAWGVSPRFTAGRADDIGTVYRIVLLVDSSHGANALALCAHPEALEPANIVAVGAPLTISGAVCRFGKTVMSVTSRAGRVDGFEDRRFQALVAATTRELTRGEQRSNRLKRDN